MADNKAEVDMVRAAPDGDLIQTYLQLRNFKKKREADLQAELASVIGLMNIVEAQLLERITSRKLQNIASKVGTAYRVQKFNVSISDIPAFREWVIDNAQWDMLDWHANKTAVLEYVQENREMAAPLPPGLNVGSVFVVNVRSSKKGS